MPNFLDLDYWQTWHYGDASMAGVYSARNNTEARAMLGFMDTDLRIDYRDTEAQFAEVERRMADDGWVRPQLLEYMRSAPDFYFDEMSQIVMDHWSIGQGGARRRRRVLLLAAVGPGDQRRAAGRLHPGRRAQSGDPARRSTTGSAFTNYFKRFQAYTKRTQLLATGQHSGRCADIAGAVRRSSSTRSRC